MYLTVFGVCLQTLNNDNGITTGGDYIKYVGGTQIFQISETRWLAVTDEESTGWTQACESLPQDIPWHILDEHTVDSTVFVTIDAGGGQHE